VYGTGSGSCPVAGFGISSVSVSNMDLREIVCEDGRWLGLVQDRVQWQVLVLVVLVLVRWILGK
jgi:hypothetical protein